MAARQVDCDWMLRRRCLDTQTLFSLLARASAGTRSVRAAVEQVCRQDARGDVRASASAVSRALRRLPVGSFDRVQRRLLSRFSHAAGRRVLAVDGSKVRVAPSLMQPLYPDSVVGGRPWPFSWVPNDAWGVCAPDAGVRAATDGDRCTLKRSTQMFTQARPRL